MDSALPRPPVHGFHKHSFLMSPLVQTWVGARDHSVRNAWLSIEKPSSLFWRKWLLYSSFHSFLSSRQFVQCTAVALKLDQHDFCFSIYNDSSNIANSKNKCFIERTDLRNQTNKWASSFHKWECYFIFVILKTAVVFKFFTLV